MEKRQFVILINHENPYIGQGGTEKYIVKQSAIYKEQDIDVIAIFPLDLREILGIPFIHGWGVIENYAFKGIKPIKDVIKLIERYNKDEECVGVYIHNIIDLNLDELYSIISFRQNITLFIHDFCTCCKQINLRKNRDYYCGDSRLYDEKCSDCRYYEKSKHLHNELESFFGKIPNLKVIAPSETAAKMWLESYPQYKNNIEVVPHLIPEGEWFDDRKDIKKEDRIKIGFIGLAVPQKGWEMFCQAVHVLREENLLDNYELVYFGQSQIKEEGITIIHVSTQQSGDNAMIDALRKNKVDAVVLFSTTPETYSFTYYESQAAHCFVITNINSGNIAHETKKDETGIVLDCNADALTDLLRNAEKIRGLINTYRSKHSFVPQGYKNVVQAAIETDNRILDNTDYHIKSSRFSAFNADKAYRIRYSSAITAVFPVYNAPKETLDRLIKKMKRKFEKKQKE